ncbi:MAG: fused MFS/spermidine synthase [Candidatus Eremiobacteraeota bacterium]|nr:fused MFS/spermidine synthase [Candidatus Eremiobacteraeota bacterium]
MPKTENFQWYVERVQDGEIHGHALTSTISQGRSAYQTYAVVESPVFGKMLVLDGDTQSAALDERIYHESLTHPACAAFGAPERILILGGGEGATLREALRVPSVAGVTMVDIDGEVVELCRRHLAEWSDGAFDDPRANIVIGDAKAFVQSGVEKFDVIIGDLTEPRDDSPSRELHTAEFYRSIAQRLNPGGFYALQASTAGPQNYQLHARMVAALGTAFEQVAPYSIYMPAFDTDWGFALCSRAQLPSLSEFARRADEHSRTCGGLSHYDGETHRRMFSLPRFLRKALSDAALGGLKQP